MAWELHGKFILAIQIEAFLTDDILFEHNRVQKWACFKEYRKTTLIYKSAKAEQKNPLY